MGTEILYFFQLQAEKIEFEILLIHIKISVFSDLSFSKFYLQTSNLFFSPSNWSKCKISVPITWENSWGFLKLTSFCFSSFALGVKVIQTFDTGGGFYRRSLYSTVHSVHMLMNQNNNNNINLLQELQEFNSCGPF